MAKAPTRRTNPALAASALAVAVLLITGCGDDDSQAIPVVTQGFPLYGPGSHWVDQVQPGTVRFTATAAVDIDLSGDGVSDATVEVSGPTTVRRTAARPTATNPDHPTHVDLEIVEMILTGSNVVVRAGDGIANLRADGPLFSIGASDESPDDPRISDDLFRIFFELEVGDVTLHNRDPLLVEAAIDRLPPIGNLFVTRGNPVELYDREGVLSPIRIVSVEYTPIGPGE